MAKLRVVPVQESSLRLLRYWIEEIHATGPAPDMAPETLLTSDVTVRASKPELSRIAEGFLVRMRVRATAPNIDIDVTISGAFTIADEPNAEGFPDLIKYNAPAVLYGLLRGVVGVVTENWGTGSVAIPSINILALTQPA